MKNQNKKEVQLKKQIESFFSMTKSFRIRYHYLGSKPVDEWDEYDYSNFRGILENYK